MKTRTGVAILILTLMVVSFAVAQRKVEKDYFGIERTQEPYKSRIKFLRRRYFEACAALENSGFIVLELQQKIDRDEGEVYVWRDNDGNQLVTEHWMGIGEFRLNERDYYLGHKNFTGDVVIFLDQDEIKFNSL